MNHINNVPLPPLGSNWRHGVIQEALTFDDILMVPVHSSIGSRSLCNMTTKFSKNITLKVPLVSSPMDTVTEYEMAIGMAQNGGIGILHRYLSVSDQVEMVRKVKRTETFINKQPYLVGKNQSLKTINELSEQLGVKTFLVTDDEELPGDYNTASLNLLMGNGSKSPQRKASCYKEQTQFPLRGILTQRDVKNQSAENQKVHQLMTPFEKLTVWKASGPDQFPSRSEAVELMIMNRVEKLPIIDGNMIVALINLRDVEKEQRFSRPNKDSSGRLLVGAAIGAKEEDIERAFKLTNNGCDVLVLDVANGHSDLCVNALIRLKEALEEQQVDIVAGSVASGEGALNLIKAGADGIRCGIGNGSICITRVVSGCGVPQFTALMDVAPICKQYGVPLISDGGNKNSGNMCKALAVGADCVMLGRLLAGCDEGPSKVIYRDGKLQKVFRGMAGFGANIAKAQRTGTVEPGSTTFTPEGVEGYIPYAGPLENVINQFTKGIQSGMSYCGAESIEQLQQNVRFIKMTSQGFTESGVHGITKI